MRKFLLGLALAAAFVVSLPSVSQAQFHTTDACNAAPSGTIAGHGLGPNGEVAIRTKIHANYSTKSGVDTVTDDFVDVLVGDLNELATNNKDTIRFTAAKFDAPVTTRNLTFYFEGYMNADGTYNVFLSVNGWAVGHLFNIAEKNAPDGGTAVVALVEKAERMLNDGYVCSN